MLSESVPITSINNNNSWFVTALRLVSHYLKSKTDWQHHYVVIWEANSFVKSDWLKQTHRQLGRLYGPAGISIFFHRGCPVIPQLVLFFFKCVINWKRAQTRTAGLPCKGIWGLAGGAQLPLRLCHSAHKSETFIDQICLLEVDYSSNSWGGGPSTVCYCVDVS